MIPLHILIANALFFISVHAVLTVVGLILLLLTVLTIVLIAWCAWNRRKKMSGKLSRFNQQLSYRTMHIQYSLSQALFVLNKTIVAGSGSLSPNEFMVFMLLHILPVYSLTMAVNDFHR